MTWRAKRNASIKTVEFPFEYRDGQKKLVESVYRTILRKKKLFIQAPTGVGKTMAAVFPAVKAVGEELGERFLSDGQDDYQNGGKSSIRDSERTGSEDEGHYIDGKRKNLFL